MKEKTYEHFDHLIENIQIFDKDWKYIYVNNAFLTLSGFKRKDLIGFSKLEKLPIKKLVPNYYKQLVTFQKKRKPIQFILEQPAATGSVRWFDIRIQPLEELTLIWRV